MRELSKVQEEKDRYYAEVLDTPVVLFLDSLSTFFLKIEPNTV